jgi:hypothetical protein
MSLTRIASLASDIRPSSSFGKNSHRFPPDFCMSKHASLTRSSPPPFAASARTLSLMQSCFRLPRGTRLTPERAASRAVAVGSAGCGGKASSSIEAGKEVLSSSEVSWRSWVCVREV